MILEDFIIAFKGRTRVTLSFRKYRYVVSVQTRKVFYSFTCWRSNELRCWCVAGYVGRGWFANVRTSFFRSVGMMSSRRSLKSLCLPAVGSGRRVVNDIKITQLTISPHEYFVYCKRNPTRVPVLLTLVPFFLPIPAPPDGSFNCNGQVSHKFG